MPQNASDSNEINKFWLITMTYTAIHAHLFDVLEFLCPALIIQLSMQRYSGDLAH